MRILILGITGMLGHRLFLELSKTHEVYGTSRADKELKFVKDKSKVFTDIDALNFSNIDNLISELKPEVVINCIGIIKQAETAKNKTLNIQINSLLPHQLLESVKKIDSKLIHFSTDCIFNGTGGNYSDEHPSNAEDLYGRSKYLGEVEDRHNALTLRTSIIGREIFPAGSLIDWFLSQNDSVNGFKNAIFSGFPTKTIAKILNDKILPNEKLCGVFNLAAKPINKHDLLVLTKNLYSKDIQIKENTEFKIDRSLNGDKLNKLIGYQAPEWEELIKDLRCDDELYTKVQS